MNTAITGLAHFVLTMVFTLSMVLGAPVVKAWAADMDDTIRQAEISDVAEIE